MAARSRSVVAAAGVVRQMALGAVYAWSVFRIPLRTFGWTISQVTLTFTIADYADSDRGVSGRFAAGAGRSVHDRCARETYRPLIVRCAVSAIFASSAVFSLASPVVFSHLTIVSSSRSKALAGSSVRPVCTADIWMIVLRGDTSQ